MAQPLLFSTFDVSRQVFFRSRLSYGLVNLKPILPGHVLVVPNRVVSRLSELTADEVSDLFRSAQRIGSVVEKAFDAKSLTIACQDGPAAGQSVPHVHIHVLPRKWVDFDGNNDLVYPAIEANEVSLEESLEGKERSRPTGTAQRQELKVDDESRTPRTAEEMEKEASWLATYFKAEDV